MEGTYVHIYVPITLKYKGSLFHEWLLSWAKTNEVINVSVYKPIAGLNHGEIEEDRFVEIGSHVPLMVCMLFKKGKEKQLIDFLKQENIELSYIHFPAFFEKI